MQRPPNTKLEDDFGDCAKYGKLMDLKMLVKQGVNANIKLGTLEETALMKAAGNGYIEVVKYLVEECKVDVNSQSSTGQTALMFAVEKNHMQTIRYLIENAKCDMDLRDERQASAFEQACAFGFVRVVSYMIEKGCKFDKDRIPRPHAWSKVTVQDIADAIKHGLGVRSGKITTSNPVYDPPPVPAPAPAAPAPEPDLKVTELESNEERKAEALKWAQADKGGELVKTGWLNKKAPHGLPYMKVWHKRWFVLRRNVLLYYNKQDDKEPIGAVPVKEMRALTWLGDEKKKGNRLDLVCTGDRIFCLEGEDRETTLEWYHKLMGITGAKEQDFIPSKELVKQKE